MLQPSMREGFLLAAIEAFFMRVPVIRSKTGGYKDMEDCCVGVPIGNVESIVQELKNGSLPLTDLILILIKRMSLL